MYSPRKSTNLQPVLALDRVSMGFYALYSLGALETSIQRHLHRSAGSWMRSRSGQAYIFSFNTTFSTADSRSDLDK